MTAHRSEASGTGSILVRARDIILAMWMIGVTLFFLVRFSFAFYRDNEAAIRAVLERFGGS